MAGYQFRGVPDSKLDLLNIEIDVLKKEVAKLEKSSTHYKTKADYKTKEAKSLRTKVDDMSNMLEIEKRAHDETISELEVISNAYDAAMNRKLYER